MPGIIATPAVTENRKVLALPFGFVRTLLEAAKTPIWLAERSGQVLLSNGSAREFLGPKGTGDASGLNLFSDLLKIEPNQIGQKIDAGENEVEMEVMRGEKKIRARVQWIAEPGCLIVQLETATFRRGCARCGDAADRAGAVAGTRDYLSEFAGGLFEIAGSESAEDGVSGIRSA